MKLRLLKPVTKPQVEVVGIGDRATVQITRGRLVEQAVTLGPNQVHAVILRKDGSIEDLGISENLLTTVGRDLLAAGLGNPTGKDGAFTATSATSGTPAGGGMTTDQYKGWRVFSPVTGLTTAPVYGNIGSNSSTVLTVDGWWVGTSDTMTGTTPAATNGYHIQPSTIARFMGLTENASAASAASTVLTGEITTGGANRAKATYAHTPAAATYTLTNTFSITASFPAIHRAGLFTAANTTAAGVLVFETVLSADANVVSGDSLAVTWTVTLSG
jgi:hypothetical protein